MIASRDASRTGRDEELHRALERWLANPVSMWTSPGLRRREILAAPSIRSRLTAVAHAVDEPRSRVTARGMTL
ncbi:hypothetical protein B9Z07_07235 [Burkholderia cenocepacia]|uniref:Uncharacterized protein n=1 Tax=Burkholderia cenocepacia TaxID=95486 RepID=A0AAD0IYI1_9BURK|nr:hypothetical protein B9Z07_07235 [Burkholderia cenocepacia]PRE36677.1 hypothetical protein C6P63_12580 [Burkholderia cenocepacia]RQU78258.1 hypothetical protein DF049_14355 [Burkholderia cenocepacia]